MKFFSDITIVVLCVLSIIILAFLSTIDSFPSGVGEEQQFNHTRALGSTTKQSGILQSIASEQNLSNMKYSSHSDSGMETEKNADNWITVNHDIYGTRHSNQTIINKENVVTLQV